MEVCVLGPVEVVDGGGTLRVSAAKQRRLLAALALGGGSARSADVLIDAIWGASPPASASKLLTVYVSQLRKALPNAGAIRTDDSGYALALDVASVDAARFERLLKEGSEALRGGNASLALSLLTRALMLWRGPAYGDLAYEEFARADAERLEGLRLLALQERFEAQLRLGQHGKILAELLAVAAENPLQERLQAQAMLALYRAGRQSEALDHCAALSRHLYAEFGLRPGAELRALQRQMLEQDPALIVTEAAERWGDELPAPPNKLLGRERELRELRTLVLRDDVRLLVLAGAGGSGKTRLALEVASDVASFFANGAAFVSLADLREPRLLVETISRALGIEEVSGREPSEALANALHDRELLLVLDNVEHLRPATVVFTQLLAGARRLTLLVTSRVVLHLMGEHVYPVGPLEDETAAALFLQRAAEAEPHFAPDASEMDVIRRICRRVDGLPLAIELAAGRTRTISPAELLNRLEPSLPLLAGGPRDAAARQQTLRATLEWSYELLGAGAQRDLARLAVFAGGCTLAAAEAVCGMTLDGLGLLLDHNLVRRGDHGGTTRYTMLETVREYADERLEAAGEAQLLRRRHAEWVRELAETASASLRGSAQTGWLDRLADEHANIRVAIEFALESRDAELALGIVASLGRYWPIRGHVREARLWLDAGLALGRPVPYHVQFEALLWQSDLAGNLRQDAAARRAAEAALTLARAHGDSMRIARSAFRLAYAAFRDDPSESENLLDLAASAAADAGAKDALAAVATVRGRIFLLRGDPRSLEILGQAAAQFAELADAQNLAEAQVAHALALIAFGRAEHARPLLDESLRICTDLRSPLFTGFCLHGLAALALHHGDARRAAALLVRADRLFDSTAGHLAGPDRELYDRLSREVCNRLTGHELAAVQSVAIGDLDDTVAFALGHSD